MFKLAENAITVCCHLNQSLMLKNRELKYFHFTGWNVVKNTSAYKILNIGSHQLVHVSSSIKVIESVVRGHILIKKNMYVLIVFSCITISNYGFVFFQNKPCG